MDFQAVPSSVRCNRLLKLGWVGLLSYIWLVCSMVWFLLSIGSKRAPKSERWKIHYKHVLKTLPTGKWQNKVNCTGRGESAIFAIVLRSQYTPPTWCMIEIHVEKTLDTVDPVVPNRMPTRNWGAPVLSSTRVIKNLWKYNAVNCDWKIYKMQKHRMVMSMTINFFVISCLTWEINYWNDW